MRDDGPRGPHLHVVGLHVHVGSQITTPSPLRARPRRDRRCWRATWRPTALPSSIWIVGGGLGIAYEPGQTRVAAEEYAAAILPAVASDGLTLVLEPGRWIVGPAGVLADRVVDHEVAGRRRIVRRSWMPG